MALVLVFVVTFALAGLAVAIGNVYLERRNRSGETADAEPDLTVLFKDEHLSSITLWHRLLAQFNFVKVLRTHLEQSGIRWSVGRLTLSMLLAGTVTVAAVMRLNWAPLWLSIAVAWLAALAPYAYVLRVRSRRFLRFQADFPDALDSISRALRAGYALPAAMDAVGRETTSPISPEFRKVSAELNLGVPIARVLDSFSNRMPLLEVELFAAAVQLHSRTGGRLTDVLSVLAENIREQGSLQGEIRAMAAQGRAAGVVLTILPVAIAVAMFFVSPGYLGVLLGHPYGKHLIGAAAACLIAAHFVMRRIVDIRI